MIEVRSSGLPREEYCGEIRSKDLIKRAQRGVADRRQRADTGIRNYNVELAELHYSFGSSAFGRFDVRHICLYGQ